MTNQCLINRLQRVVCLLLLGGVCLFSLTGCNGQEVGELKQICFERENGSTWGNQFYIEVCAEQILVVSYFPEGSSEQKTLERLPVTETQWNELCQAVQALKLIPEKTSVWQKLFSDRKMDGGDFRKLTLVWQTDSGEKTIVYQWPNGPQAEQLERLLELIVPEQYR